ncbi:MAG: hypothetical protein Q7K25_10350 [Actinomycetota bacterium]|nr:hypothetical protein [Actinomycetota bacterium]
MHNREPGGEAIRPNLVLTRLLAGMTFSLALIFIAPALASGAPSASSSPAAQLPREVAEFRKSMTSQLDHYFQDYGDRLSGRERVEMDSLRSQVDQELVALQGKTRITARLESRNASKAALMTAARTAARAFDRTYARAIAGLQRVQPILQPKLSLFEAFGAKSDLDEQLSRFEELGMRIHQVAGN